MSYRKYWLACVICKEKDYHILKEKASQSERERETHTHTHTETDRQTDRQTETWQNFKNVQCTK